MVTHFPKCNLMFFTYIFGQGGAERVILNILNHIDNSKYNITLVLGTKNDNHQYLPLLTNKKIKIDYLNVPFGNNKRAAISLAQKIRQYHPDIVFTEAKYTNIISYRAKKLSKNHNLKLIFREANTRSIADHPTFIQKAKLSFIYNFSAKKIICVSNGVASDLINHYKIRPKSISIINNPIDTEFINNKSKEKIDNASFLSAKGQKIINVARLVPAKNQLLLIKAFHKMNYKNASLFFIGTGELEDNLKNYCKENHIKNVYFLGYSNNPYKYIKASDLFVLSSNHEGFSNVIIESLALGTPVISTDCPSGSKDILKNNEYGIITPANDYQRLASSMKKMLSNKKLLEQYSQKGLERSQDFNVKNIIKEYESIIDQVYTGVAL